MNQPSANARPTVSPFRYYRGALVPQGYLFTIIGHPSGPELDARMREGAVITADDVAAMNTKLEISLSAEDLEELRHALNLMRVTVYPTKALSFHFDAYQETSQRVEKNIAALIEDLPKLIKLHRDLDDERAAASAGILEKTLSEVSRYFAERWIAWGGRVPSRRHEWWHDDAVYLWTILNGAAAREGKELPITHAGAPAIAFIVDALGRAKVQHGGAEALAQALARFRQRLARDLEAMRTRSAISAT